MRFEVSFDGWFSVEADNEDAAFDKVFDLLNDVLSPHCEGGRVGDWEVSTVEEDFGYVEEDN